MPIASGTWMLEILLNSHDPRPYPYVDDISLLKQDVFGHGCGKWLSDPEREKGSAPVSYPTLTHQHSDAEFQDLTSECSFKVDKELNPVAD